MTGLTILVLDRLMLRSIRHIVMAGQAKSSLKRLQLDFRSGNFMAVVAITTADRWMHHLPE